MKKIVSKDKSVPMKELLSYATSNVEKEYVKYIQSQNRELYGFEFEGETVGCIGVEINNPHLCEIKHIAVSPIMRENGIASEMIRYMSDLYPIDYIFAETDKDAVAFYEKYGFKTTSLGEKYPGVERFLCELHFR
ncbi:GNAT family N-acetyltransferase [Jeotgalibacillus sp. JSM ZJ347]|uniref:GNAT family N-acetyltransferase n=1 Tax=Jeotgalibacillus sp. JSM ZJ347 TaxID=3342117 RepID=UPI0035A87D80